MRKIVWLKLLLSGCGLMNQDNAVQAPGPLGKRAVPRRGANPRHRLVYDYLKSPRLLPHSQPVLLPALPPP